MLFFVLPFLAFARGSEVLFLLLLLEFIPRACCSTGHIPPFCRYRPPPLLAIDLFLRDELCLP